MLGIISGAVAGLVAITPASGFVLPGPALIIGIAAGVVCFWSATSLKHLLGYDDSLDAFGVHGVGGIVGALLTGVFAYGPLSATRSKPEGVVGGMELFKAGDAVAPRWSAAASSPSSCSRSSTSSIGLRVTRGRGARGPRRRAARRTPGLSSPPPARAGAGLSRTGLLRFYGGMKLLLRLLPLLLAAPAALAFDPVPAAGRGGMVVSAQSLATDVGVAVLRDGGNAVDAAVAVGYALAVTYPAAGNLGGGGFMTLRLPDGQHAVPGLPREGADGGHGRHVPGRGRRRREGPLHRHLAGGRACRARIAGLEEARARWGTLPRAALLAPAIRLAREGFVLGPGDAPLFAVAAPGLAQRPGGRRDLHA